MVIVMTRPRVFPGQIRLCHTSDAGKEEETTEHQGHGKDRIAQKPCEHLNKAHFKKHECCAERSKIGHNNERKAERLLQIPPLERTSGKGNKIAATTAVQKRGHTESAPGNPFPLVLADKWAKGYPQPLERRPPEEIKEKRLVVQCGSNLPEPALIKPAAGPETTVHPLRGDTRKSSCLQDPAGHGLGLLGEHPGKPFRVPGHAPGDTQELLDDASVQGTSCCQGYQRPVHPWP